ncbi:MAG: flagellar M-ring protein FliF [Caulobacteraceae bacterium]|nr:flagellar M-ring protein FliF [Caulobacteraceae bacterium]
MLLIFLMLKVGSEPSALLYSNLDLKEAAEITAALDQANIKYEAKGDGSTIMVPRDKVASTRLMLSSKGLPTSGSVGYEIFDNASALGQTDFVQNLNRQRALEGELARTIRSLDGVTSARVHLVLPRRQLFEEEAAAPTASIVVGLGHRDLSGDQVRSLRNLVAGAVPNLKPEHVTVVDESGKMLAAGSEDDGASASAMADDRKTEVEERLRRAIRDVVEGVVGPGKARVQVTADVDETRVTEQRQTFDPDGQVVRSTTTSEETSSDTSASPDGAVGAAANLPGGAAPGLGSTNGSQSGNTQETTNYEISNTTRTEVIEPGAIKRLSVAVAVDGVSTTDRDGKVTYAPRSAADMQKIEQLVRSAMGYDQSRQDQVQVVNVRFNRDADGVDGGTSSTPFSFDKNDIMRGVELLVLLVVGLLIIFFVVRPLLKSAGGPGGGAMPVPALAMAAGGAPQLTDGSNVVAFSPAGAGGQLSLPGPSEMEQRIDIARIEGGLKTSSVKRVAEFVDNHPEESISILRGWLHET